jgi:hypothetical protein
MYRSLACRELALYFTVVAAAIVVTCQQIDSLWTLSICIALMMAMLKYAVVNDFLVNDS